jgi:hypothetical protein
MDAADGGEIDEWFAGHVRAWQEHALRVAVLPRGGSVGFGLRPALSPSPAG